MMGLYLDRLSSCFGPSGFKLFHKVTTSGAVVINQSRLSQSCTGVLTDIVNARRRMQIPSCYGTKRMARRMHIPKAEMS